MRLTSDQLQKLVDASSFVFFRISADWQELLELVRGEFLADAAAESNWLEAYVPAIDRDAVLARISEAVAARAPYEFEHRIFFRDGSIGWIQVRVLPHLKADGEVEEWYGSAINVTDRRHAEDALRVNEERQAFLLSLSDAIRPLSDPTAIKAETARLLGTYLECDRVLYADVNEDQVGLTIDAEFCRTGIDSIVGSLDFKNLGAAVVSSLLDGRPFFAADVSRLGGLSDDERSDYERIGVAAFVAAPIIKVGQLRGLLVVHQMTVRTWSPLQVLTLQEVADRTWEAAERMRTEMALRASEGRLRTLVSELQHRTHNLISVITLIASRTFRAHPDPEEFKSSFGDSLRALSRAQRLLSKIEEGKRVTFDELLRSEFAALPSWEGDVGRVTFDGPSGIRLRSSTVQTLQLAVHELARNAVKHGALSSTTGKLFIRWRLSQDRDQRCWIEVDWRESGVQTCPASSPLKKGLGCELIEKALPYQLEARTSLEFTGDGVHCTIAFPVSETQLAPRSLC
jgi:two-component sensor histidine kinase